FSRIFRWNRKSSKTRRKSYRKPRFTTSKKKVIILKFILVNYRLLLFFLLIFVSCKSESDKKESLPTTTTQTPTETNSLELGKKLFNGKGTCLACHKPDQKIIGPSIVEIAQIYKDQNADMVE